MFNKLPIKTKRTNILNKIYYVDDKMDQYNKNKIGHLEFAKVISHKFNRII